MQIKQRFYNEGVKKMKIRIGDIGHARNIHFLVDKDADAAMNVASEMVTELDLSDQDVINVAAIIDAEILALVPEWQPKEDFDKDICIGSQLSQFFS